MASGHGLTSDLETSKVSNSISCLLKSPLDQLLSLLERLMDGETPDLAEIKRVNDTIKTVKDIRRPMNLHHLLADERFTPETGSALYSLIGDNSLRQLRRSIDYRPRPSISFLPQKHILTKAQFSWDFDAKEITVAQPLTTLAMYLISGEDLIKRLRLDRQKLFNFLSAIESSYCKLPYHNSYHVCAVLQYMHILLTLGGIKDKCQLDEQTILACYVAALAHDMGHKGLTNDFLIESNDDIAITYNDVSPLENFHASSCIRTLRRPECNFISAESTITYNDFKKLICKLILATDLKQHFQLLSIFQNEDLKSDSVSALQIAIKCADLSHMCGSFLKHSEWVQLLQQEFWRQGDVERLRGMSTGPLMDRSICVPIQGTQKGFFQLIGLPMFQAFSDVFPDAKPMFDAAIKNFNMWMNQGQQTAERNDEND